MNVKSRFCSLLLILVGLCCSFAADGKHKNSVPNYEISGAGTGSQGSYLVSVTVISKKNNPNDDVFKRAAVHGVLFRGFSNTEHRQMQKPLAGNASNEAQHADFYQEFFSETGNAGNYASIVDSSRKVVKSGKDYRVTVTVSVSKEELRSYLESLGILRGLNTIF